MKLLDLDSYFLYTILFILYCIFPCNIFMALSAIGICTHIADIAKPRTFTDSCLLPKSIFRIIGKKKNFQGLRSDFRKSKNFFTISKLVVHPHLIFLSCCHAKSIAFNCNVSWIIQDLTTNFHKQKMCNTLTLSYGISQEYMMFYNLSQKIASCMSKCSYSLYCAVLGLMKFHLMCKI